MQKLLIPKHLRGFLNSQEVFWKILASSLAKRVQHDMCDKQSLFLPGSYCFFGVADPYDILEPGEIFVKLYKSNDDDFCEEVVLFQEVLVTRQPCIGTEGVQLLRCANYSVLKTLVNVVVFSTKGDVPDWANLGGDLDGD